MGKRILLFLTSYEFGLVCFLLKLDTHFHISIHILTQRENMINRHCGYKQGTQVNPQALKDSGGTHNENRRYHAVVAKEIFATYSTCAIPLSSAF